MGILRSIAERIVGFVAGTAIGLAACPLAPVFNDPIDCIPASVLALIPVNQRLLTYRETVRGCGEGYIQGYVASDGARAWATNMVAVDARYPEEALDLLERSASSVISCETTSGPRGELVGFQLFVQPEGERESPNVVVLYSLAGGRLLEVGGPCERYVRDVERIERGERVLLRAWMRPGALN